MTAKIKIDYIHGQSFHPREIFEGTFFMNSNNYEEVAEVVISIIKEGYFEENESVWINTFDKNLKNLIQQKIWKNNPDTMISNREHSCGCDFGFNVTITKPNDLEDLQNQRNKLNRQISKLKRGEYKPSKEEEKQLLHNTDVYLDGFFSGKKQQEKEASLKKATLQK